LYEQVERPTGSGVLKRPGVRAPRSGSQAGKPMSTNTPTDYESTDSNQPTVREAARIPDYELLDVDGATLVYSTVTEHRGHLGREVKIGRFLAGVADVTDRSKLRGELARLGHPVAEAHLLEEFDAEEVGREVNYHV